jgi:hypothetical protein
MIDPDLAKRWQVTGSFLEQAKQLLPSDIHQSVGDAGLSPLTDFEKYLAANELELAFDELESLGEICDEDYRGEYWLRLEKAASTMELVGRTTEFHKKFCEFWRCKADQRWDAIEEDIFANNKLSALKAIRDLASCDLSHALTLFYNRYADLRRAEPQRFTDSEDEYWAGFYS